MTSDDLITPKLVLAATRMAPLITADCPFIRFILASTSAGQIVQLDKRLSSIHAGRSFRFPEKMSDEDVTPRTSLRFVITVN